MKDLMKLFPALKFDFFFEDEAYGYASGLEIHLLGNDNMGFFVAFPDENNRRYTVAQCGEEDVDNYFYFKELGDAINHAAGFWDIKRILS